MLEDSPCCGFAHRLQVHHRQPVRRDFDHPVVRRAGALMVHPSELRHDVDLPSLDRGQPREEELGAQIRVGSGLCGELQQQDVLVNRGSTIDGAPS